MFKVGLLLLACMVFGCRAAAGENCSCGEDCRSGLVCALAGDRLEPGQCLEKGSQQGTCVDEDDIPEQQAPLDMPAPLMDMGSKRDFQPDPDPSASDTLGSTSLAPTTGTAATTAAESGSSAGTTETPTTTGSDTATGTTNTSAP